MEVNHRNGATKPASETISDVVFRQIRQDIISGALKPGAKIKLDQAKERYSVSVASLREILNRLTTEKFVVAEGQKGFEVSPATRQELLELTDLRILLETYAIGLSFESGDLEWESRIVEAHHKLAAAERHLMAGDDSKTMAWVRLDWEFHQAMISACQSKILIATLSAVFDRFLRYHLLAGSFRGAAVAEDHRALYELALKRDVQRAREMIQAHVRNGMDHVLARYSFGMP